LICIVISGKSLYINDLESARCNSNDIRKFAKEAKEIGIQYIGLCCGNSASYFRELAETYGRTTPASKYSPDMTMNSIFGEEQNDMVYNVWYILSDVIILLVSTTDKHCIVADTEKLSSI
jgi:hypothetical protein